MTSAGTISDFLAQAGSPGTSPADLIKWGVVILTAMAMMVFLVLIGQVFGLWFQALFAGATISWQELIGMKFRRVDARVIVLARIRAVHGGLDVTTIALESHYLAGGRVGKVVDALVAARAAGVPLVWEEAAARDLAGDDLIQHVDSLCRKKA